jgi:hypothetical protein
MREALREVYGTEISTAARIGAFLRHVATVAAALVSRKDEALSGRYRDGCHSADVAECGWQRSRSDQAIRAHRPKRLSGQGVYYDLLWNLLWKERV